MLRIAHGAGIGGLLLLSAGCPVNLACTEIGCSGSLALTVVDANDEPVEGMAGTIEVGGQVFAVDCAGASDDGVSCAGGVITLDLPQELGGDDVVVDLAGPGGVTASGTLFPEWTENLPNGEACPPTCWTAEAGIALDDA